jgi:hypothetical protein
MAALFQARRFSETDSVLLPVAVEQSDGLAVSNANDPSLQEFGPDGGAEGREKEQEQRGHTSFRSLQYVSHRRHITIIMLSRYLTAVLPLLNSTIVRD